MFPSRWRDTELQSNDNTYDPRTSLVQNRPCRYFLATRTVEISELEAPAWVAERDYWRARHDPNKIGRSMCSQIE